MIPRWPTRAAVRVRFAVRAVWNLCLVTLVCWVLCCAAIVALYFLLIIALWHVFGLLARKVAHA